MIVNTFGNAEEVLGFLGVIDRIFRPDGIAFFVEKIFAAIDFFEFFGDGTAFHNFLVSRTDEVMLDVDAMFLPVLVDAGEPSGDAREEFDVFAALG